jgi:hypothetical protein
MCHRFIAALLGSLVLVGACLDAAASTRADTVPTQSRIVLVELFTSEGCSSCPPADELLRRINNKRTAAGQLILGISEHVTYWNNLGWKDPYSSDDVTERQSAYARHFGLNSVYTPQIIVNGDQQIVGSDEGALLRAIEAQNNRPQVSLRILSVTRSADALTVQFAGDQVGPGQPLDIMAALTDDADRSHVVRGENSGRDLQHVAVARALVRVASMGHSAKETVRIPLPKSILEARDAGHHLILFAQQQGMGSIVGADSVSF